MHVFLEILHKCLRKVVNLALPESHNKLLDPELQGYALVECAKYEAFPVHLVQPL